MKKLLVHYDGWGERWHLGTLADNGEDLLFEYSAEARRRGLELSPLHLGLQEPAYGGFPPYLQRLPGLVADSLPDGWGLLLMDRLFRRAGLDPARVSVLDRLAFLGDRAMGALTYEPATAQDESVIDVPLATLGRDVQTVVSGAGDEALGRLAQLGGSPQGARPKVLVYYNPQRDSVSTVPRQGHVPWFVKFPAQAEHKEVCALEDLYATLARRSGLDMPESRSFDLGASLAAFGVARFDREAGMRVPVHTLAGALHADFRFPSVDYVTFLRAVRRFTQDEREVARAYERAVFNVVFNNRDDHSKNVSLRLGRDRRWRLAPCYDLTFSSGPRGEHQMDVCGYGRDITRANMLDLARLGGVAAGIASAALERVSAVAGEFRVLAQDWKIRKATVAEVAKTIEANCARLA